PALTRQAQAIVTGAPLDPAAFAPEMRLHLDAGRDHVVPRFTPAQTATLHDLALVQDEPAGDGTRRRRYRAAFPGYVRHLTVHYLDNRRIGFM
ncbi:hypothetical protein LAM24_22250, partial [Mycobacterium tuberculosis]|nr:hypothetical protein [Mycobacterium tuberculosis]